MYDSHDYLLPLHKRDIDGKLAIALDEFLGAIQWIYQPKPLPQLAIFIREVLPLF